MPHRDTPGIPSVTQVLSVINKYEFPHSGLLRWVANNGYDQSQKIKKTAGLVGTRVHDEIQRLLEGREPKLKNKAVREMVNNFNTQFIQPYKVKPVAIEPSEPLIDKEVGYAGTFDAVVQLYDGVPRLAIADWKTSSMIDDRMWPLQLSAYANLWNLSPMATTEGFVQDGFVIRIDKKTHNIEGPIWFSNLDKYFSHFLAALMLYNYMLKKGIWKE